MNNYQTFFRFFSAGCLFLTGVSLPAHSQSPVRPPVESFAQRMITAPPDSMHLDTFYKKYTDAFGVPIVSSGNVPDDALLVARDIINYMLMKRMDVREQMAKDHSRLIIEAVTEMETDLPEHRNWKKPAKDDRRLTPGERDNYDKPGGIASMSDREYWNKRARGMGGNVTSCAEENLLGYPGTRYYGENIMMHEFSHNIMRALGKTDPALTAEINAAYQAAKAKDMYKGQYAINTVAEYWAEGTQWWFWSNIEFYDGNTRVQTPDELKAYDPTLYDILSRVYVGHHVPGDVYYSRNLHPIKRKQ